jgi:hypothetical protein
MVETIYIGGSNNTVPTSFITDISQNNSNIIDSCSAVNNGGAISIINDNGFVLNIDIKYMEIKNCSAKNGGSYYLSNCNLEYTNSNGSNPNNEITNCTASNNGNMFYLDNQSVLNMNNILMSQLNNSNTIIYVSESSTIIMSYFVIIEPSLLSYTLLLCNGILRIDNCKFNTGTSKSLIVNNSGTNKNTIQYCSILNNLIDNSDNSIIVNQSGELDIVNTLIRGLYFIRGYSPNRNRELRYHEYY